MDRELSEKALARIERAKEIFTFCMESDDPRLDEVIWIKTLPLSNPRANQVHNYSEPITVRKAVLATLFEFPNRINVDNRTIDDDGVRYYEGKSKFIAPSDCSAEQQQEIVETKKRLEEVVSQLGDGVTSGQKGNVSINVNLWLEIEDIDLDNIVEWLNSYCARNVDRVGTRETELVSVSTTREFLDRAGIEISDLRFRRSPDREKKETTITSRDIVEAVEVKEIPESINGKKSLKDIFAEIGKYFEEKSLERFQRRMGRRSERDARREEAAKWDFRM